MAKKYTSYEANVMAKKLNKVPSKKQNLNPVIFWSCTVSTVQVGDKPKLELPKVEELIKILQPACDDFVFAIEEGDNLGKTHYQCFFKLKKRIKTGIAVLRYFETFGLSSETFCQYQVSKAHDPKALEIYSQKTLREGNENVYRKDDYRNLRLQADYDFPLNENQLLIDQAVKNSFQQDRMITYVCDQFSGLGKTTYIKSLCLNMHAAKECGFRTWLVPDSSLASIYYFICKIVSDGLAANLNQKFLFVFNFNYSDTRLSDVTQSYQLMESIVDGIFSTSFAGKCLQVIAPRCSCQVLVMANETPRYSQIGSNRFKVINLKLLPKNL